MYSSMKQQTPRLGNHTRSLLICQNMKHASLTVLASHRQPASKSAICVKQVAPLEGVAAYLSTRVTRSVDREHIADGQSLVRPVSAPRQDALVVTGREWEVCARPFARRSATEG
jgi:hypothetical protein